MNINSDYFCLLVVCQIGMIMGGTSILAPIYKMCWGGLVASRVVLLFLVTFTYLVPTEVVMLLYSTLWTSPQ